MLVDIEGSFDADGVVVVRNLLDEGWCRRLHRAIEDCRAAPGPHYGVLSGESLPRVDSDLFRWFDNETMRAATHRSPLVAVAGALLGTDEVILVEDQWFCSMPGALTPSPWHQDHPYYNLDRAFLTLWVTLDDVDPEAALRVVKGSHSAGALYAPVEFSATSSTIGRSDRLEPVPDVDNETDRFAVSTWSLAAGDAIAIDSRILHATGIAAVKGRTFRRLSTRWATPDTIYRDQGPGVANFWSMLPHGLADGDPLACETFPLLPVPS